MKLNVTFEEATTTFSAETDTQPKRIDATFGTLTVLHGGGVQFTTDETLTLENGVLSVNTANAVEQDNTLPITAAAVHTTVGNIEALLETI